jgi:uncharacterized membrane protein
MKQDQYLNELKMHLQALPAAEVEEILADYREHFEIGRSSGKTDETIVKGLGRPRIVAQNHVMNSLILEANSSPSLVRRSSLLLKILFIFFVLAPINFLILLGPFLVASILIFVGWVVPIAIASFSISLIGALLFSTSKLALGFLLSGSILFAFLGVLGISVLMGLIMLVVSRLFIQLISQYVKWNINFVTEPQTEPQSQASGKA